MTPTSRPGQKAGLAWAVTVESTLMTCRLKRRGWRGLRSCRLHKKRIGGASWRGTSGEIWGIIEQRTSIGHARLQHACHPGTLPSTEVGRKCRTSDA